jgi:hypothetical protein
MTNMKKRFGPGILLLVACAAMAGQHRADDDRPSRDPQKEPGRPQAAQPGPRGGGRNTAPRSDAPPRQAPRGAHPQPPVRGSAPPAPRPPQPRGSVKRVEINRGHDGRMHIQRGPRGQRTVETRRPGGRVVSYGPRNGFVERSVRPGYISRTYVRGGRSYAHMYRGYRYLGFPYYHYMPAVYYGPRFYGWVLTPWSRPVRYLWFGIGRPAPWFRFYAGYFTPYPYYGAPDLWLTDYLLAEDLRLAYESQSASSSGPALATGTNEPTVSPAMKALIADEVQKQIAAERADAARPAIPEWVGSADPEQRPAAFRQRFFVVSSNLEVAASGQSCALSPGDIIQRLGSDVSRDGTVAAEVIASQPGNCAADSAFGIQIADLQEMQNQFRAQIDAGMQLMAQNQAPGLPPAPEGNARTVFTTAPAAGAAEQLASQEQAARQLEDEAHAGGSSLPR